VRLRLSGLTLTPSGIMVCAYPADRAAGDFAARLAAALGPDGWFEEHYDRNIWYATVLHFAAAIEDRAALVRWVADRRDLPLGEARFDAADLVRFEHRAGHPAPVSLARAPFAGG
jgi:hypothetical protein